MLLPLRTAVTLPLLVALTLSDALVVPVPAARSRHRGAIDIATTTTSTALSYMGGLSDDILLTHRPLHDISHAWATWVPQLTLPPWKLLFPNAQVLKTSATICYGCLGLALMRLGASGATIQTLTTLVWMVHLLGTFTSAQLAFGLQRLRPALAIQTTLLLTSMPLLLWAIQNIHWTITCLLLPYTAWLTFVVALLHQVCRFNPISMNE